MDGVQLFQGYRVTTRRVTTYHSVARFPGVPGTQLIALGRMKD